MPKSRKLLAVPFVGKDVPSRASEFSHPDVVIGKALNHGSDIYYRRSFNMSWDLSMTAR